MQNNDAAPIALQIARDTENKHNVNIGKLAIELSKNQCLILHTIIACLRVKATTFLMEEPLVAGCISWRRLQLFFLKKISPTVDIATVRRCYSDRRGMAFAMERRRYSDGLDLHFLKTFIQSVAIETERVVDLATQIRGRRYCDEMTATGKKTLFRSKIDHLY